MKREFVSKLKHGADHSFVLSADTASAHRHTNPDGSVGGWVADTALVDESAFLCEKTEILEFATVECDAMIYNSIVGGFCIVKAGAVVEDCHLYDNTVVERYSGDYIDT